MAKIAPFKGLRPRADIVDKVAAPPYDVSNKDELDATKWNHFNFNHITRSEVDLPETTHRNSPEVYLKAKDNLDRFIKEGILIQDNQECYYIYQIVMNGRSQTGLVCCSSLEDYAQDRIKKHEFTQPDRVLDRANHIKVTGAHTGLVFLACKDVADMNQTLEQWKAQQDPVYKFASEDGISHTFWVVDQPEVIAHITRVFDEQVPNTYIADGHHRTASASQVAEEFTLKKGIAPGDQYYLTCIFPESQVAIMDYNRLVLDMGSTSEAALLSALEEDFDVQEAPDNSPYRPSRSHEFGMYLGKQWYILRVKPGTYKDNAVDILDVSILQQNVFSKILGIHDPRTDNRLEFVGGIRGLAYLQERVDKGTSAVAFSCYPVSVGQLFEVADSGSVMPPKSTWFEPKTRDGLVVHLLNHSTKQ